MKIDYKRNYDENGYCYNQTITINEKMARNFNDFANNERERIAKAKNLDWLDEKEKNNHYLQNVKNGLNFCNLTTLHFFIRFLNLENQDTKRVKSDRNTILQVVKDTKEGGLIENS